MELLVEVEVEVEIEVVEVVVRVDGAAAAQQAGLGRPTTMRRASCAVDEPIWLIALRRRVSQSQKWKEEHPSR